MLLVADKCIPTLLAHSTHQEEILEGSHKAVMAAEAAAFRSAKETFYSWLAPTKQH